MKPIDLNIDDYQKAVEAFHGETDRAAAVLAGGFIESYLAKYLRSFMVADVPETDLFENFGPFATLNQRYETAYAFGWLSNAQRNDLKFVAKIRNHFAHHPVHTSFNEGPVSDWCRQLSSVGSQAQLGITHTNRDVYLLSISMCVGVMHNSMLARAEGRNS